MKKMKTRTPRNRRRRLLILHYMISFARDEGRQPSVREIGEAAGLMSTSTTAGYLNRMVNEGLLERNSSARRNYFVTENGAAMIMGRRAG